jgi:hypothetical protein
VGIKLTRADPPEPLRRFILIAILVAAILLTWLVISALPPKEPSYKGRTLSQWLLPYSIDMGRDSIEDPERVRLRAEATEAMHAIGTNAIPTLLTWLQSKDSPESLLKLKMLSFLRRHHLIRIHHLDPYYKGIMAKYGFALLGNDARTAVPALVQIGNDTNYDWSLPFICLLPIDTNAANKLASDRMILEENAKRLAATNSSTAK